MPKCRFGLFVHDITVCVAQPNFLLVGEFKRFRSLSATSALYILYDSTVFYGVTFFHFCIEKIKVKIVLKTLTKQKMTTFNISDFNFEHNNQSSESSEPSINLGLDESVNLQFEPEAEFDFEEDEVLSGCPEAEIFENLCINLFQQLQISGLSRDKINMVNKSLVNLLELTMTIVGHQDTESNNLNACFRVLIDIIKSQSTDYKRESTSRNSDFYVGAIPVVYGSKFVQVRRNNRPVHINKPLVMYVVPIKSTIQALFRNQIFRESYFNGHQCEEGVISNFCCGSAFSSGSFSAIRQKNALRIQLYCDTMNLSDALKQNANDHKMGAVYFRILNLHPLVLSQLRNIHLLGKLSECPQ